MKPENQEPTTRWYQEPYMLLVAGIPLIAVIWGFVMLKTALETKDSLVSDSYYKDGMSYTQDLESDEKAKRLQITGTAIFTADEVRISIDGYLDEYPSILKVAMIHPTLDTKDTHLVLQQMDGNSYAGVNDVELPSRWRIWVDSPEQGWRIRAYPLIEAGKEIQLNSK